jgi:hypothetical protein
MSENIIELPGSEKIKQQAAHAAESEQKQLAAPLTGAQVQQAVEAYKRLSEIASSKIVNPRDEAEKTGLINFLQGFFLEHAGEFFGCWVAIQNEYSPLVNGFTQLLARATARLSQMNEKH